jgi:hypothetical protein
MRGAVRSDRGACRVGRRSPKVMAKLIFAMNLSLDGFVDH